VRIVLWILLAFFGALFLAVASAFRMEGFKDTSWGRQFKAMLELLGAALAVLAWILLSMPSPASAP
jgi:hypothetical protein